MHKPGVHARPGQQRFAGRSRLLLPGHGDESLERAVVAGCERCGLRPDPGPAREHAAALACSIDPVVGAGIFGDYIQQAGDSLFNTVMVTATPKDNSGAVTLTDTVTATFS